MVHSKHIKCAWKCIGYHSFKSFPWVMPENTSKFFFAFHFFLVCKKIAEQIELKMKSYKTNLEYLINGRVFRIKSIKFVSSVDAAGIYRGIKMFIKLDQFKALHLIVERHGNKFKKKHNMSMAMVVCIRRCSFPIFPYIDILIWRKINKQL